MIETATQSNRVAKLTTPLGGDTLVLLRMDGTEALSELFEFRVEALTSEASIDTDALIGHPVHIELGVEGGNKRYFHGLCTDVRWLGGRNERDHYELVLRPWLWLTTRQSDNRIFANLSVKDIINKVFSDAGFTHVEFKLQGQLSPLPYTVQYQETNFAFVNRLMERYGLYYFFEHTAEKHQLIITDHKGAHTAPARYAEVPYYPPQNAPRERDHLTEWSMVSRLRTEKVSVQDYNHTRASTNLSGMTQATVQHGSTGNEFYAYPAGYTETGKARNIAQVILDAERSQAQRFFGSGYAGGLGAGSKFKVAKDPLPTAGSDYLVIRASHSITSDEYRTGTGDSTPPYQGSLECQLWDTPFRVPLRTPWPRMSGPQTAKVVGAQGEEIDVDDKGRILVHFHWERAGKPSCRVRVAQVWAGSGWGGVYIPRIGQEVVVEYIEGDPDRPLVTGAVYNSDHAPPLTLPGDKTQSTLKSNSSKGGGGFNEYRFEDKKGQEQIYTHAQKDQVTEVLNDDTLTVGRDQKITIKRHRNEEVTDGNETIDIKTGNRTVTIDTGNEKLQVKTGNRDTLVDTGNDTHIVKTGNLDTQVNTGNETRTIKMGNRTTKIDMGNDDLKLGMGNLTTKLNMGNITEKAALGSIKIEAMQGIELKVGGSSIKMDMMSITLKAPMIKIDAQMMFEAKGGIMAKVEGSAMLTLKGGITMIG